MSLSQALILYYLPFALHIGYSKQAKQLKLLWYVGQRSKYQYRQAWQMDYIALPQTYQTTHLKWWRQPLDGWKHNP